MFIVYNYFAPKHKMLITIHVYGYIFVIFIQKGYENFLTIYLAIVIMSSDMFIVHILILEFIVTQQRVFMIMILML